MSGWFRCILICRLAAIAAQALFGLSGAWAQDPKPIPLLPGRIVAVGIPGAGAVSPVGFFHPGSPIHENPAWSSYLQPGKVLDPRRVLVTSTSNFGAPRARENEPESAVLSIDPIGQDVVVAPTDLATRASPAMTLDGRVQVFTSQSLGFIDASPGASQGASLPPISNPLGIAVNNGTGWLRFANNPGAAGRGSASIVTPTGLPIHFGSISDRILGGGAIGVALIGKAFDGYWGSVFAVLTPDGALMQAPHGKASLPLAPAGTITPLALPAAANMATTLVTRAGMVFNWVPDRILYVSDPVRNTVVALKLADDGAGFRVDSMRRIEAPEMNAPIDLAPAVPEVANPGLSSNTVLAGGADFYVLNRGNGVILRMNQAGQTVAARQVAVLGETIGGGRLNGIAVSRDAQRLWLTVTGGLPGHPDTAGGLIEAPAFGPTRSAPLTQSQQSALIERGAELFQTAFTPEQGLGPLYNGTSCRECHQFPSLGGAGPDGLAVVYRVGRFNNGAYDPLLGGGGPVSRKHSIGAGCKLIPGIPSLANLVSVRNTPALFGAGLIDLIPDRAIRVGAAAQAAEVGGIAGRPHVVRDASGQERVGKFGWKADTATLEQFIAEAMRNEMGLTSPLAPQDIVAVPSGCGLLAAPKFDSTVSLALKAFISSLPAPAPAADAAHPQGAALFASVGCARCHTPSLPADGVEVRLFSDLLLHDMGRSLDDGVVQGQARGRDWRTTPLWGLGVRVRYLHDGRATNLGAAIAAHEGEAMRSANAFRALPRDAKAHLLTYLGSL